MGQRASTEFAVSRSKSQTPNQEERLLIEQLKGGDREAFDTIFRRYVTQVYRQVFRLVGNEADAEEVVQEVFLAVYQKSKTFRGESAFSTWLYRLTLNVALTRLRRRKRGKEICLDDYLPRFQEDGHHQVRPVVDWSDKHDHRLENKELQQFIRRALDELPPVDKAVVVMSDLEGTSNREIGKALGLSIPAVKARLHRARLVLRGRLAVSLGYSPT